MLLSIGLLLTELRFDEFHELVLVGLCAGVIESLLKLLVGAEIEENVEEK